MGLYINPGMDKKLWLEQNAIPLTQEEYDNFDYDHKRLTEIPVCLVDNGHFTAAAVAYNDRERDAFSLKIDPNIPLEQQDTRPRQYFLIEIDKLDGKVGVDPDLLKQYTEL